MKANLLSWLVPAPLRFGGDAPALGPPSQWSARPTCSTCTYWDQSGTAATFGCGHCTGIQGREWTDREPWPPTTRGAVFVTEPGYTADLVTGSAFSCAMHRSGRPGPSAGSLPGPRGRR